MIRVRIFRVNIDFCDNTWTMEHYKRTSPVAYKLQIKGRDEAFAPIEDFIAEVGFENIRKITTSGDLHKTVCVFFYEDGMPYVSRAKVQPPPPPPKPKQGWFGR